MYCTIFWHIDIFLVCSIILKSLSISTVFLLGGSSCACSSLTPLVVLAPPTGQTLRLSWTWSAGWPKLPEPSTPCTAPTGPKVEPVRWPWVRLSRGPLRPPVTSSSSMIWRYGPSHFLSFFLHLMEGKYGIRLSQYQNFHWTHNNTFEIMSLSAQYWVENLIVDLLIYSFGTLDTIKFCFFVLF